MSNTVHRRKTRSRQGTSGRTAREHSAPKREEYRSERLVQKEKYWTKPAARRDIRANMPPICRTARSAAASRKGAEEPSNLSGSPRRSRGASSACRKSTTGQKPAAKQKAGLKRIPLAGRSRNPFRPGRNGVHSIGQTGTPPFLASALSVRQTGETPGKLRGPPPERRRKQSLGVG